MIHDWYAQKKQERPECILLICIGDFYEAFDEDAHTVADVCNVIVYPRTLSTGTVDMAGFPAAVLMRYLLLLRKAGYDVRTVDLADKWAEDDLGAS
jgi:DNA mismatch repair protein MutS